jgi:hypothetical protein
MGDLPAVSETVPGYSSTTWFGVWVPLNTPKDIVNRLNQGVGRILKQQDVQERLRANAYEPGHNTPAEFNRFIVEEIAKCLGNCPANTVNRSDVRGGRLVTLRQPQPDVPDLLYRPKSLKQIARSDCADMANAKPKEQLGAIWCAFCFNRCQQVIHRLILPSITR